MPYTGNAFVSFWGGEAGMATPIQPIMKDSVYFLTCFLRKTAISSADPANITFRFSSDDSISFSNIQNNVIVNRFTDKKMFVFVGLARGKLILICSLNLLNLTTKLPT